MQTIEERLDQLERRNKRLTAALAVMAVAMCAVVTVAATGLGEVSRFDTVLAIAEKYDNVFCTVGVHPHNAADEPEVTTTRFGSSSTSYQRP